MIRNCATVSPAPAGASPVSIDGTTRRLPYGRKCITQSRTEIRPTIGPGPLRLEFLVVGGLAVAGFLALWLAGTRGPWEGLVAAVAMAGVAAVAVLVPRRPV